MTTQHPPRPVQLLFFFLPTKPKKDNIYWSIIKITDKETQEEELHYTYVKFEDGEFVVPVSDKRDITVEAWCELVHPSLLFEKPKPTIIKPKIIRANGSKFIPQKR